MYNNGLEKIALRGASQIDNYNNIWEGDRAKENEIIRACNTHEKESEFIRILLGKP
jgi:hypothetical protein